MNPIPTVNEVESLLEKGGQSTYSRNEWIDYLAFTGRSSWLSSLESDEMRTRWAEAVFRIIRQINFGLLDLLLLRVSEHPGRILFRDLSMNPPVDWTYEQIYHHLREIAALILQHGKAPRVALYTENCLEGACTDLACLTHGIFVTPLSPHFRQDVLLAIFDRLEIDTAFADTPERLHTLLNLRETTRRPFRIFALSEGSNLPRGIDFMPETSRRITLGETAQKLDNRSPVPVGRVATTMFTSGSTGLPKGVSFSIYNIVSKRFARAAALPQVDDQTFLCYLPLYHTFGRYLEMTGAIYWHGTYVFAGNTSAETLLNQFPQVNPTGFISIPLRWQELYEKCQERIGDITNPTLREACVRDVVGHRLSWGLSAAGYLDPRVFRFFNHYGIHLCSGFGMTEATGGITMTPPGHYRENSVGIPLPGVYTRLTGDSELQLSGHYIARYLDDAGPDDMIPITGDPGSDYWLPTGDVFRVGAGNYHEIIDRVKDIYKNNRGQTVAPQVVEKKFFRVPGFRQTFLVGDNRPYNVLLIVPDTHDPLYHSLKGNNLNEYYHRIVMAVNAEVAPYERVINFALVDREFDTVHGELTPKGSFNRKAIEKNFLPLIEGLYTGNTITIQAAGLTVMIPKWFFRDLGVLESDIIFRKNQLINRQTKSVLRIRKTSANHWIIGDFIYRIESGQVDLGILTRQPRLWAGNHALAAFCPLKEGWDLQTGNIGLHVRISRFTRKDTLTFQAPASVRDQKLMSIHHLLAKICFGRPEESIPATEELGEMFAIIEIRLADLLRQRLEALAWHPSEAIRVLAYRLILLRAPRPELIPQLPTFIESGLSFLNEESIRIIAASNLGKHRLDSLKQRMHYYRTHLPWPASRKTRTQFTHVLQLLFTFGVNHLDFYVPVRAELSRWILHRQDPFLSKKARELFDKLSAHFENQIEQRFPSWPEAVWREKIVFEHGISEHNKERILKIFKNTTFFQESVLLTFNEWDFSLENVPQKGIWILRMVSFKEFLHFRMSINTINGKHYDLHMVMSDRQRFRPRPETFYWLASLAGFPHGPAVAPLLGSSRPGLGVLTTQLIGGLTAWDKIREVSAIHQSAGMIKPNAWKKIFIQSFTVVYTAWHHSGYQIVPGAITPVNIAVPEMDFRESAVILSLAGWSAYKNTLSLVEPMIQDFYCRTAALFPMSRKELDIRWIFDAAVEALGKEEAGKFLQQLREDAGDRHVVCFDNLDLITHLESYLRNDINRFYFHLALFNAIDQYSEWHRMNPLTTAAAREQTILELMELYRLNQHPVVVRFCFYRHTFFSGHSPDILRAFDRLLDIMQQQPAILPIQLIELSELQSALPDPDDKPVFSRMVFPRLQNEQHLGFLKIGDTSAVHMVVQFSIHDSTGKMFIIREPIEPREIGQLYQLFFREKYPKEIRNDDHQMVLTDEEGKVTGGLTWRYLEEKHVLLDGIVVTSVLQGRGLARALTENFFTTMAARGVELVKAHFLFGNYYLKHYFEIDQRWGALVKVLKKDQASEKTSQE